MILVTGSSGLIGSALVSNLRDHWSMTCFDNKENDYADVRDYDKVRTAMCHCSGVVHLAAVSRIEAAERDKKHATAVNEYGTANVAKAAQELGCWMIYASSREVYGNAETLPVTEEAPFKPLSHYGSTKARAEHVLTNKGLERFAILRFSNVYGSFRDHPDRVVPAFMSAARDGKDLNVYGPDTVLDFVHVSDVVRGIIRTISALERGKKLAPMHFTTGEGTSLGELALQCRRLYKSNSTVWHLDPRQPVTKFYGDASLAREQIGWKPYLTLEDGLLMMKENT